MSVFELYDQYCSFFKFEIFFWVVLELGLWLFDDCCINVVVVVDGFQDVIGSISLFEFYGKFRICVVKYRNVCIIILLCVILYLSEGCVYFIIIFQYFYGDIKCYFCQFFFKFFGFIQLSFEVQERIVYDLIQKVKVLFLWVYIVVWLFVKDVLIQFFDVFVKVV